MPCGNAWCRWIERLPQRSAITAESTRSPPFYVPGYSPRPGRASASRPVADHTCERCTRAGAVLYSIHRTATRHRHAPCKQGEHQWCSLAQPARKPRREAGPAHTFVRDSSIFEHFEEDTMHRLDLVEQLGRERQELLLRQAAQRRQANPFVRTLAAQLANLKPRLMQRVVALVGTWAPAES